MTNRFFAVTGMHRSGSSLVAQIINVLGVDLGPEDALLPGNRDNPRGFWENRQVFEFHDELLASLGGEWDRPPLLEDGWERSPDLAGFRQRAVDIVDEVFDGSEVAAWKDPRGSLLLPLWKTVVDISGTVLCLRHPAEVAASLRKRDGFESEWSAYLWLRYAVAAYRADPAHFLLRYDELFDGFDGVVERLIGFLSIDKLGDEAMAVVRDALDPSLRHHHEIEVPKGPMMERAVAFFELIAAGPAPGTGQLIDSVYERWVLANRVERSLEARMFQLWEELRADYPDIEFPYTGDSLSGGPDAFETRSPFSPSQDLPAEAEVRRLFGRIGTSLADRLELAERVVERDRLRGELAEQVAEGDRLRGELAEQLTERDRMAGAFADRVAEGDRLRHEVADRVIEGVQLRDEIAHSAAEGERMRSEAADLRDQATNARSELAEVRASTSWRLTAPMRAVGDRLPRLAKAGRRFLKLVWWTLTLQIFRRVPEYVRWRRAASTPSPSSDLGFGRAGPTSTASELKFFTEPGPLFEDFDPAIAANLPARAKLIAFYLPQFHAIPENDEWWGPGFTEWRNLARGLPRFVGHYQPRIPRDLGFYDLADSEAMRRQIELARAAGIGGFCFYHYLFDEGPLLEKPLESLLADSTLDIPFCLMWVNENWTRTWDGLDEDVLMAQTYRPDLEDRLLGDFARHFADERYVRIDGRPLLIIYRPGLIPHSRQTIARWRDRLIAEFDEEPWIIMAQGFGDEDPRSFGLDGAVEFPPHKLAGRAPEVKESLTILDSDFSGNVRAYEDVMDAALAEDSAGYPLIRTVVPSWDNDARRPGRGLTLADSTPARYEQWLRGAIGFARSKPFAGEPLVFVNAWNEWAEAAYLEPDVHFGSAYLNATARALVGQPPEAARHQILLVGHDAHEHGAQLLLLNLGRLLTRKFGFDVTYLLLGGGALVDRYREIGEVVIVAPGTAELTRAVEELASSGVRRAVTNTTVTGTVVPELDAAGFSIVSLIHELPGLIGERGLERAAGAIASTSDAVVFASEIVADGFRSVTGDPVDRAEIMPQGLYSPPVTSTGDRGAVGDELGIAASTKIVLGVGYGDLRKGFDLFVATARNAARKDPDLCFLWVGNVDAEVSHWLLGDDPGSNNLRIVSFTDEVSKYYGAADVLFLSSREDPFPSTVLEAMAAGLPVVAFEDSTGCEELIGEFGKLAEAQDPAAALSAIREVIAVEGESSQAQARRDVISLDFRFDSYAFSLLQLLDPDLQKVSVVVPSYNYEPHLEGRLDSIFEQRYPVFEVIVLDDASTDGSVDELARIARSRARDFSIVVNEDNSGSIMRQWLGGASRSTGDLLWIAEADDLAEPGFLADMVEALLPGSINLGFSDSIQIDSDGEILAESYGYYFETVDERRFQDSFVMDGDAFLRDYLSVKNLMLNVSGVLFRRDALVEVLEANLEELAAYAFAGDWQVYASLCMTGQVAFVAGSQNIHRRHDQSATHRADGVAHVAEIERVQSFIADAVDLSGPALDRQTEYRREIGRQLGVDV